MAYDPNQYDPSQTQYGQQAPPQYGAPQYGAPPQYTQPPSYTPVYDVPPQIRKWNWGAFMFNFAWGVGNKAWLALLCLIPIFNIVWVFVCGAKGNEWAWKTGEFKDVETFLAVQKTWNRAGLVSFIITIVFVVIYFIMIALFGAALFSYGYNPYYYSYY